MCEWKQNLIWSSHVEDADGDHYHDDDDDAIELKLLLKDERQNNKSHIFHVYERNYKHNHTCFNDRDNKM